MNLKQEVKQMRKELYSFCDKYENAVVKVHEQHKAEQRQLKSVIRNLEEKLEALASENNKLLKDRDRALLELTKVKTLYI